MVDNFYQYVIMSATFIYFKVYLQLCCKFLCSELRFNKIQ